MIRQLTGSQVLRGLRRAGWGTRSFTRVSPPTRVRLCQLRLNSDMADADKPAEAPKIVTNEKALGNEEAFDFAANTQELLGLVARSLYTDKEIFIRELVSNCSDALEKLRYEQTVNTGSLAPRASEMKITITCDENRTLVIQDSGIGMVREDIVRNLGTIAQSGSREFVKKMKEAQSKNESIIGQFGVGFYSVFTVAKEVKVYTRGSGVDAKGYLFKTDGQRYSIQEAENVEQGTKIVIDLKDEDYTYAQKFVVEKILKKYSSFVLFPIYLNGVRVNTTAALWKETPNKVASTQHDEFFKILSKSNSTPMYTLHFKTEVPMATTALLYFPREHTERFGATMHRMESNISLYCRNVMIQQKARNVVPDFLRFVTGVVDSEDMSPILNMSREQIQDSTLLQRLNNIITRKILRWLEEQHKEDPDKFGKFFSEFGHFLKEGVCTSFTHKAEIAKLLRFESTQTAPGETINLDTYLSRMKEGQKHIYYLNTVSRAAAIASPYMEAFEKKDVEVLILTGGPIDSALMGTLGEYKQKLFKSAEISDTQLDTVKNKDTQDTSQITQSDLPIDDVKKFAHWLQTVALTDKILEARPSTRLDSHPAMLFDHEDSHTRRIRLMLNPEMMNQPLGKQRLEFNPKHTVIKKLFELSQDSSENAQLMAKTIAEQMFDNAVISAGLLDNPMTIVHRLQKIVELALNNVNVGPK